ncbi:MAG: hypothetical protein ABI700_17550 [Chloroflexota bacterium]
MTRVTLVLKFLGLTAFWGLVLGAGLGLVGGVLFGISSLSLGTVLYLVILFAPISAVYGTLLGGSGIVLGIITTIFFYRPDQLTRYKFATLVILSVITFTAVFLWFALPLDYASNAVLNGLIYVIAIAVIATLAAGYASQRIAKWYLWWNEFNYIRPISV